MSTGWTGPDIANAVGVCISALLGIGGIVLGVRQERRAHRSEIREVDRLLPRIRVTAIKEAVRGEEPRPGIAGPPAALTVKAVNIGKEMVVVDHLYLREMRRGNLKPCLYMSSRDALPCRLDPGEFFKMGARSFDLIEALDELGVHDEFAIVAVCVDAYGKEYVSNQVLGDMRKVSP